jgi:hypothetical protein
MDLKENMVYIMRVGKGKFSASHLWMKRNPDIEKQVTRRQRSSHTRMTVAPMRVEVGTSVLAGCR